MRLIYDLGNQRICLVRSNGCGDKYGLVVGRNVDLCFFCNVFANRLARVVVPMEKDGVLGRAFACEGDEGLMVRVIGQIELFYFQWYAS